MLFLLFSPGAGGNRPVTLTLSFLLCDWLIEVCDSPLVTNLPPSSFRSSTQLTSSHGPVFAKVNRREGAGGWSPLVSDQYQWLEVDLGRRTQITAVATQGRYGSSDWMTAYLLMFSDTGHNWRQYRQEDSLGVKISAFPGNNNADTVVQYKLKQPVIARYLHLIPLDWNPTGRIGLRLEMYGCQYISDVANFDGSNSLLYRLSVWPSWTGKEVISLKFKTLKNSGTLLHAEGQRDHSLTLVLEKGRLLLYHQQGAASTNTHIRQRTPVYNVQYLTLYTIYKCHMSCVLVQLSLGAVQSHGLQKPILSSRNFHGCLENVLYNDLNLIDLAKRSNQQVSVVGNVTFSCAEPVSIAVTFTDSQSFLQLPGLTSWPSWIVSLSLQFRTWNKAGLLLTFDLLHFKTNRLTEPNQQFNELNLCLCLCVHKGLGLNDGQWHSVELNCRRDHLSITVDRDEGATAHTTIPLPLTADSQLFFGGKCTLQFHSHLHSLLNPFRVFQGCMRLLTLDNQPVNLIKVQQRLLGNYSHLQIDMCGIIDRCSPSRCEHGGRCNQSWNTFHCNCTNSGYRGATCHSSIYEQSCEAYKHKGNTSGHYYVDVDGSGPINPQLIYCNMTEDRAWMVIQHNNTELTTVPLSAETNQHLTHFDYASAEEQIAAIIGQSEHCEQELSYLCRKSRLLNTPEGAPFSWWEGGPGPGQVQTHWGGALPGSRQCACGLQDNCLDSNHYCNCDADYDQWVNDSGLITHKETLPVRSLLLGDIQRPGSEAAYRVGPLRCHGDNNLWNAAFFDKETSYLHFPTFHGELNADISFLFKTPSSSGVFLENLGIKDFIRIELRSSTEVVFSFDVGNGPLEVRVEKSAPLNDNRWHRVRAERNVKEASLQVDEFPAISKEAPADGHIHLQLNSQLFIGTASRQKGFLGCIRSLQLNGVTLDLEGRAKITPGVRPGCPGHCSSYGSLCQNHGRCMERASGFSCDCGPSAYTGSFCHQEVSASFESTTSITYILKEPSELSRNRSALPSSKSADMTLRGENISLSFRTSQRPASLLYISSFYGEYLALLINEHGDFFFLPLCYDPYSNPSSFSQELTCFLNHSSVPFCVRFKENSWSRFTRCETTGCLSSVHFNSISPLKAALLHSDSPVSVTGPLAQSSCGSSSPANPHTAETTHSLPGTRSTLSSYFPYPPLYHKPKLLFVFLGVIAVVIFVTAAALAIVARFICSRKETYRNQEVKGAQPEDGHEFRFSSQADCQSTTSENQREFFI
uniref:Uncharacterized protein n=1 Tax=Mola mola TaxID=94237 RepID=A0A3Q4ASU4_MOLML